MMKNIVPLTMISGHEFSDEDFVFGWQFVEHMLLADGAGGCRGGPVLLDEDRWEAGDRAGLPAHRTCRGSSEFDGLKGYSSSLNEA